MKQEPDIKPKEAPKRVVVEWWVAKTDGHVAGMITAPTEAVAVAALQQEFLGQNKAVTVKHVEEASEREILEGLAIGAMMALTSIFGAVMQATGQGRPGPGRPGGRH